MKDKVFCDSNIFLYAFSTQDVKKQKISSNIIVSNCTISTQVINEVSNNMIKKLKFDNQKIKKFIDSCYTRYEIVNFSKDIFIDACDIRENFNISYYDSLIVSSALNSKCKILYSEDMQHNQAIRDLEIVNPFYL